LCDGEYHTRRTLRALLLTSGCSRIHEATEWEAGLEAIHTLAPDLVLLDCELPGMGGAHFVRRLRGAGFQGASVPIILLVGREERARVLEAVRLGVHEFLLKPISSGALRARLVSAQGGAQSTPKRDRQPASEVRKMAS